VKQRALFIVLSLTLTLGQAQLRSANTTGNVYIYNHGHDTIFLSKLSLLGVEISFNCDTLQIIDSIQVDGTGAKEIVFYRHCSGVSGRHGGSFDVTESAVLTKYEIWNLDTKHLLLEATNHYACNYDRFFVPRHIIGAESYYY
jgi:hypothetical protein